MIILTIRTDKPEAEVGLYRDNVQLGYETWTAHRELSATIHKRIADILSSNSLTLEGIEGIVVYTGPGSFTGLRIGISLANALAYSLNIPIIGISNEGWIVKGVGVLLSAPQNLKPNTVPEYGGPAHTTLQKK